MFPYKVYIIESEKDWGQRVDEIREFDTEDEADAFVIKFNSANTGDVTPDWYMYARRSDIQ